MRSSSIPNPFSQCSANTIQMSSSVFIHSICSKECKTFWLQSLQWPNMDWNEENDVTLPHSIELHLCILPVHTEKNKSTEDNHRRLSKSSVFCWDMAWRGMKSFCHIAISVISCVSILSFMASTWENNLFCLSQSPQQWLNKRKRKTNFSKKKAGNKKNKLATSFLIAHHPTPPVMGKIKVNNPLYRILWCAPSVVLVIMATESGR